VNLKSWTRKVIDASLARYGYALARTSIPRTGWDQVLATALAQGHCPLVLDIGAHRGGFSQLVLDACPRANVYAFEPIPDLFPHIQALSVRYPNLKGVPLALGSEPADFEFHVHSYKEASSLLKMNLAYRSLYPGQAAVAQTICVRVERLDDWAVETGLDPAQALDLVKMDVQGFEGRVILGGQKTLRRSRYLVTEAALFPSYDGGVMLDELCEQLRELKFELIWGFNIFAGSADLFWHNKESIDTAAASSSDRPQLRTLV